MSAHTEIPADPHPIRCQSCGAANYGCECPDMSAQGLAADETEG